MDGRGRALDNVFIERRWRSLKYELIYPGDFASGADLLPALDRYFHFYNDQRPHQALGYRTPADLFPLRSIKEKVIAMMGGAAPRAPGPPGIYRCFLLEWMILIWQRSATTINGKA